jgi:hypothetical protein
LCKGGKGTRFLLQETEKWLARFEWGYSSPGKRRTGKVGQQGCTSKWLTCLGDFERYMFGG